MKNCNILFLANYFPPIGGPGTFRPYFFVKNLVNRVGKITVITADKDPVYGADQSLTLVESPRLETVRLPSAGLDSLSHFLAKFRLLGLFRFIFFLWTWERQAIWANRLKKHVEKRIRSGETFDVIYATSGPFVTVWAAYKLSKKFDIPLVVDFRDPFSLSPSRKFSSYLHFAYFERIERKILTHSRKMIVVSPGMKQDYLEKYPDLKKEKIEVIFNGAEFDVDTLASRINNQVSRFNEKIRIVYAGSLRDWDGKELKSEYSSWDLPFSLNHYNMEYRSLHILIQALALFEDTENLKEKVSIEIYSGSSLPNTQKLIQTHGLEEVFNFHGKVPYAEVKESMRSADLLLLPMEERFDGKPSCFVTGKVFEYMNAGKPILLVGNKLNDVSVLFEQLAYPIVWAEHQPQKLKNALKDFLKGETSFQITYPVVNIEKLEQLSRKSQAEQLYNILQYATGNQTKGERPFEASPEELSKSESATYS